MAAIESAVAQQAEGHPEVVLRDAAGAGNIVAKVPNGQTLSIIQRHGDQVQVQWDAAQPPVQGWAKATNIKPMAPESASSQPSSSTPVVDSTAAFMQQADGHPDVVLRDGTGAVVAKVPNLQPVKILQQSGDQVQVQWSGVQGWAKVTNVQRGIAPGQGVVVDIDGAAAGYDGAAARPAAVLAGIMVVGGGVEMLRCQYLAGFKEDRVASHPTIARPDINAPFTIDGNLDDLSKKYPELMSCCWNDVKMCSCGKPCAFTMTSCNSCGKPLPETISKSDNVFTAFLMGVKSATRGFPYMISTRRETEEFLIFDDMLQLCPCHLNGIPKNYYIPDWRYLLLCPKESLVLLKSLEAELWAATLPFIQDPTFRKAIYRGQVTDEDIRKNIMISFNFPPSQFQLHLQWLVPPLTPFQHYMAEIKNHFHQGRAIPFSYVCNVLALDKPYPVTKDTPLETIFEHYKGLGVDYASEWAVWFDKICLGSTLGMQNWKPDDFKYVVQDGKAHNFTVADGKIQLGDVDADAVPNDIQGKDKTILQNYGRPYSAAGKPTGTYIINALETKFGAGGYQTWPDRGATVDGVKEVSTSSTGAACGSCSVS